MIMKLSKVFTKIWLASQLKAAAKVKLAEYTLETGGIVSIDDETKEATLAVEGKEPEPIPVAEYKTTDNKLLIVLEVGKIAEIKDLTTPAEATVEASKVGNAQMSDHVIKLAEQVGQLKAENASLKSEKEVLLARIVELEKEPAAEDIVTDVHLSDAKAKPKKHYSELLIDKLEEMKKNHPDHFDDPYVKN